MHPATAASEEGIFRFAGDRRTRPSALPYQGYHDLVFRREQASCSGFIVKIADHTSQDRRYHAKVNDDDSIVTVGGQGRPQLISNHMDSVLDRSYRKGKLLGDFGIFEALDIQ